MASGGIWTEGSQKLLSTLAVLLLTVDCSVTLTLALLL